MNNIWTPGQPLVDDVMVLPRLKPLVSRLEKLEHSLSEITALKDWLIKKTPNDEYRRTILMYLESNLVVVKSLIESTPGETPDHD